MYGHLALIILHAFTQIIGFSFSSEPVINPYTYSVTLSTEPCRDEDLVIVVHSAAQNIQRRMLMRSTWLNKKVLEDVLQLDIKIVFVTGSTHNLTVQKHLHYEKDFYDDVIQSSFIDSYYNNTLKAISYMRWVSSDQGCPNARLLLKVDDDALLNFNCAHQLRSILFYLMSSPNQYVYAGQYMSREVNRKPESIWCTSREVWAADLWPVWFQGLAYVITPKLASKLYTVALTTKYMFTDDVYVAILVDKLSNVFIKPYYTFSLHDYLNDTKRFKRDLMRNRYIFAHVPDSPPFYTYFEELKDNRCCILSDCIFFICMLLATSFVFTFAWKLFKFFCHKRRDRFNSKIF